MTKMIWTYAVYSVLGWDSDWDRGELRSVSCAQHHMDLLRLLRKTVANSRRRRLDISSAGTSCVDWSQMGVPLLHYFTLLN